MTYRGVHPEVTELLEEADVLPYFKSTLQQYALRAISSKFYHYDKLFNDFEAYKKQNNHEWQVKYDYLEARHKEVLEKLCGKE